MILERINPMGLKYALVEEGDKTRIVLLSRRTATDPKKEMVVDMDINLISAMWYRWQMKGMMVQRAFERLTAEQREFLMTGITPTEWKEIFSENNEEN